MKNYHNIWTSLLAITVFCISELHAQSDGVTLRFSANHTCAHAELDSVLIENLSQGGSTTLYYPDTVVTFVFTDIGTIDDPHQGLYVSQNYPNPFSDHTMIDVFVSEEDHVELAVYDLSGRRLTGYQTHLVPGMHQFSFHACGQQVYVLIVTSQKHARTRLMLQMAPGRRSVSNLVYEGAASQAGIKSSGSGFVFNLGDELQFTGYVTDDWGALDYATITDSPETDQDYLFDIANEVPEQPSEIAGETTVMSNETGLVYEVEQVQGLTYLWTVPGDWTITHGQGSYSITADAGIESGDITVQAENDCGTGPGSVLNVKVLFILTLTANPEHGGQVTGAGHYAAGEEVTITATANEGWEFVNWTGDTGFIDSPDSETAIVTMPAENISLTANFVEEDDDDPDDPDDPDGTVVDIDGNVYQTVIIGNQEWMAENLRVTRDASGNNITRYCYGNNTANCELYGGLYTWHTIMNGQSSSSSNPSGVQGICPTGWHVPSHHEWTQLEQYICNALGNSNCATQFPYDHSTWGWRGTNEGNALKSCRQVGSPLGGDCDTSEHPRWDSHSTHYGFDEFGFSALPGGLRGPHGSFGGIGLLGYWWSSAEDSSTHAWYRNMFHGHGGVNRPYYNKSYGFSLRCVRVID